MYCTSSLLVSKYAHMHHVTHFTHTRTDISWHMTWHTHSTHTYITCTGFAHTRHQSYTYLPKIPLYIWYVYMHTRKCNKLTEKAEGGGGGMVEMGVAVHTIWEAPNTMRGDRNWALLQATLFPVPGLPGNVMHTLVMSNVSSHAYSVHFCPYVCSLEHKVSAHMHMYTYTQVFTHR